MKLGNPDGSGAMPLEIGAKQTPDKDWGGSATYSTYGQRYSGRDVVTVSGWKSIGHDTQLNANYSEGLSDLRKDSKGGFYHSANVGVDTVTSIGTVSVKAGHTEYKPGGDMLPYNIHGNIDRVDIELDMPLSAKTSVLVGGGYISQKTDIRGANLQSSSKFGYASAGVRYTGETGSATAKVIQGLGGSEQSNSVSLNGNFNPNFTAVNVEGRKSVDLGSGFGLDLYGTAQKSSKGTPGAMQFYGGGMDRGRAYHTGNIAAPSGYAGSVALTKKVSDSVSVYAGADGAVVYPDVGARQSQKSVFIGAKGAFADSSLSWDLSVTKAINPIDPRDKGIGLMFYINKQF